MWQGVMGKESTMKRRVVRKKDGIVKMAMW